MKSLERQAKNIASYSADNQNLGKTRIYRELL